MLTLALMALERSPTITERFFWARDVVDPRSGRETGTTYQGFMKALRRRADQLLPRVQRYLRTAVRHTAGRQWWTRRGWVVMTVDGTKIDAPRTAANERVLGVVGKDKTHPQMLLTTIRHAGTGLAWDWRVGPVRSSEQNHLREMIDDLPGEALVIADALYVGFDLLSRLHESGRSFLVRVGANVSLLRELGFEVREEKDTVYLWPACWRKDRSPLVLRLIRIKRGTRTMFLVTNVMDRDRLSHEDAVFFYEMRWGAEVFFRSTKQTLERRTMRCAAPEQAMLELHGTMIGMVLLGLMSVAAVIARGKDPLSWSVAAALKVVRRAMGRPRKSAASLIHELGACIKDTYHRKHPKTKRPWARKKTESPPRHPAVRRATRAERLEAQSLQPN